MTEFFKNIPFGQILRNFLAGVVFLIAAAWANSSHVATLNTQSKDNVIGLLFLALVIGILIYIFSRAIVIPCSEWLRFQILGYKPVNCSYCFSVSFADHIVRRWRCDITKDSTERKVFSDKLREWADYVHFAFMAGIAFLIGAAFGETDWLSKVQKPSDVTNLVPPWYIWVVALSCLVIGLFSDFRKQMVENYLFYKLDIGKNPAQDGSEAPIPPGP
jgi:hypothetical protein